jgi:hypothetical protein
VTKYIIGLLKKAAELFKKKQTVTIIPKHSSSFFNSHIVLTANILCHRSLSDFVFLLEILDPTSSAMMENCLFPTLHVEKPTAVLSFSNVNKVRKKINKCEDLKNKRNFTGSKAITDTVIKNHLNGNRTPAARNVGKCANN